MKRVWATCAVLLCLVVVTGLWWRHTTDSPEAVPLLHVARPSVDLGTVPLTDDPLVFDYEVENWGQAPLRINGTILSCGCTKPEIPESDIAPNHSARVRLRIDPEAAGEKQVSVTLLTNDPLNPKYALRAHWITTTGISASPPNLDFGAVEAGRSTSLLVQITKMDERIRILSVTGEPETIQATLDGERLTVSLTPDSYPMSGTGVVRLSLKGGKTRPFLIPITWHVDHAYQAHPSSLFLGYTKPGEVLAGVVHIKDRESRDVAIDHWEWQEELPGARCEATQDSLGLDQFSVKWTAPTQPGLHRGVVMIQVAEYKIPIPISALVGTAAP